jgi:hypothetical protein
MLVKGKLSRGFARQGRDRSASSLPSQKAISFGRFSPNRDFLVRGKTIGGESGGQSDTLDLLRIFRIRTANSRVSINPSNPVYLREPLSIF